MELVDFYLKVTYGGHLFTIFTDHCLFFFLFAIFTNHCPRCLLICLGPEASGLTFERSDLEKEKSCGIHLSACGPLELLKLDSPSA